MNLNDANLGCSNNWKDVLNLGKLRGQISRLPPKKVLCYQLYFMINVNFNDKACFMTVYILTFSFYNLSKFGLQF